MLNLFNRRTVLAAAVTGVLASAPAWTRADVTFTSPDGQITGTVKVVSGRLTYNFSRDSGSTPVVLDSALGITIKGTGLASATDLGNGVTLGSPTTSTINQTYAMYGVHSTGTDNANVYSIPVTQTATGKQYTLELCAYDDGVAYRYVVPGTGQQQILGEATSWQLPTTATTWFQNTDSDPGYFEGTWNKGSITSISNGTGVNAPLVFKLAGGSYGMVTEGALLSYSGMKLTSNGAGKFSAVFPEFQIRADDNDKTAYFPPGFTLPDDRWRVTGTVTTPWRLTTSVADLNGLVNTDLVRNVNPARGNPNPSNPSQTWDFAQPGRAAWSWWNDSNVTVAKQYDYVDKAALLGFQYVLVDEGWRNWSNRDQSVKDLVAYAKAKGIGIWLWDNESMADNGLPQNEIWPWNGASTRDNYYQYIKSLGVVGVKLDFISSESQAAMTWYEGNLKTSAKYGIMLDVHGANKPTGYERSFPQLMAYEGVGGLEYNKTGNPRSASYNATLPFTRNVMGPMDYTPVTFQLSKMGATSNAHQLATAVVFTSPMTVWADDPAYYLYDGGNAANGPNPAVDVIKDLPTVWDQTLVLPGSEIGDVAAFARRVRNRWFVGILNDETQRNNFSVALSFLGDGAYKATLLKDNMGSQNAFVKQVQAVNATMTLALSMRSSGGFVGEFSPLAAGDANMDGSVDGSDVALWAQNFTGALGANPANARTFEQGDWNLDGSVDGSDVALWAQNFTGALGGALGELGVDAAGLSPEASASVAGIGTAVVPEPAAGLLAMGMAGLLLDAPEGRAADAHGKWVCLQIREAEALMVGRTFLSAWIR